MIFEGTYKIYNIFGGNTVFFPNEIEKESILENCYSNDRLCMYVVPFKCVGSKSLRNIVDELALVEAASCKILSSEAVS
jgi:hypothetical protein